MADGKLFVPTSSAELADELARLTGSKADAREIMGGAQRADDGRSFEDISGAVLPSAMITTYGGQLTGVVDKVGTARPVTSCNFIADVDRLDDKTVAAATNLFVGGWSRSFVHGPDAMLSVSQLLGELLDKDEEVSAIEDLQFRGLMTSNVRLVATADEDSDSFRKACDSGGKPVLIAKISTDKGRRISLRGDLIGKPIQLVANQNPYARAMADGFSDADVMQDGTYVFNVKPLRGVSREACLKLRDEGGFGFTVNTLMDTVMNTGRVLSDSYPGYSDRGVFAAGFRDFQIGDLSRIVDGCELEVKMAPRTEWVSTGRGFVIVPRTFCFCDIETGSVLSEGKYSVGVPKSERVIDDYLDETLPRR